MWKYQNVNITADNLPDNKFGFIYMFTLTKNCKIDGKLYKGGTIYIGKKQLNFKRRKLITLKQKRLDPSLKRRKYEYIVKASDWETYYSSSEIIKKIVSSHGGDIIKREILLFCETKYQLSFNEIKQMIIHNVDVVPSFNGTIGKFFISKLK